MTGRTCNVEWEMLSTEVKGGVSMTRPGQDRAVSVMVYAYFPVSCNVLRCMNNELAYICASFHS